MMQLRPSPSLRMACALWLLFSSVDAMAYLDPNAGGLIYQILLPVIVAVTAGWRYLKMWLKSALQRLTQTKAKTKTDAQSHLAGDEDDSAT